MKYPCPCCGYLMFEESPGSYAICKICGWEDDDTQLRFPDIVIGANYISLLDAQKNFQEFGAFDRKHIDQVRKPTEDDQKDPQWRPIDLSRDIPKESEIKDGKSYFDAVDTTEKDRTKFYYWKKGD